MKDWIIKNGNGDVVGKYRSENKPKLDSSLDVVEVDDAGEFEVSEWHDE